MENPVLLEPENIVCGSGKLGTLHWNLTWKPGAPPRFGKLRATPFILRAFLLLFFLLFLLLFLLLFFLLFLLLTHFTLLSMLLLWLGSKDVLPILLDLAT